MSETEKTEVEKTEVEAPVARKPNPFIYIPEEKRPTLLELNRRTRDLNSERRAELDVAHDQVAKAVATAFGKKGAKPVSPKGSPASTELKAQAAAAKAKAEK